MSGKERFPDTRISGNRLLNYQLTSLKKFVIVLFIIGTAFAFFATQRLTDSLNPGVSSQKNAPTYLNYSKPVILSRCDALKFTPSPPQDFHSREESDRFEPGTNATLIRNCVIFTGKDNGTEVIHGDILLDKGIIKGLGKISGRIIDNIPNLTIINANHAWVTPGLVDLHSHLGVLSTPITAGAMDVSSPNGPILPWLRSVDGLNTHDDAYELAMAGGVTSAQVLPGSSNIIGGQAFIVKFRKPQDRSTSSMIVEPPYSLNTPADDIDSHEPFRWRHMIQACGESVRQYGTRMDTIWALRSAYNQAMKIKVSQDEYCSKAESGLWESLDGPFPDDFRWEMLVDVLRGKVKISNHCHEAVDLDAMVRLTNEFKFRIASFHQASEAWLVPGLLKRVWGEKPSVAISATNYRFKREAFRGSEYAARVLADNGIPVIMNSNHPVINSRYLIYEAQQAYYFGLPPHLALASVTSTPAMAAGLSHRIGILAVGADADVVLWDSHPLRLGATPVKVWIDGILQIPVPSKTDEEENHVEVGKGKEGDKWRQLPETPNWDKERKAALRWDGLPPLEGRKSSTKVVFTNIKEVWKRSWNGDIERAFSAEPFGGQHVKLGTVVVEEGRMTCIGVHCSNKSGDATEIDLHGGTISPGLMSYGSPLGLEEIISELSTSDGESYDAFKANIPKILDDVGGVVRAMDALMFSTRNALTAYRSGVTSATSSLARPVYLGGPNAHVIAGLSTTFCTGSAHAMQVGAIIQDVAGLHVVLGKSHPTLRRVSVSTQIAALRRLLYGWESTDKETGAWFRKAAEGVVPLVVEVDSADIMASLLIIKAEVEDKIGSRMRMVFSGAMEAHLLAEEIGNADVGVILNPARPFPMVWDQRRILPGPPLTNDTALSTLLEHGVVVGLGVRTAWEARNARFDVQWAVLESNTRISERQAYALVTRDLERLLGVRGIDEESADLVAFDSGSIFNFSSKVVGVISTRRGSVELF